MSERKSSVLSVGFVGVGVFQTVPRIMQPPLLKRPQVFTLTFVSSVRKQTRSLLEFRQDVCASFRGINTPLMLDVRCRLCFRQKLLIEREPQMHPFSSTGPPELQAQSAIKAPALVHHMSLNATLFTGGCEA